VHTGDFLWQFAAAHGAFSRVITRQVADKTDLVPRSAADGDSMRCW